MIEYENLAKTNADYMRELESAAKKVIRSGWYVLGEEVRSFETEFSEYVGAKYCISVANGLDALILAIEALDLPKGSDILVASNTYIATILAIVRAGHKPILVEPVIDTFNMDPDRICEAITPKTRALCVTHLFGKTCRMDAIESIAIENGLKLIEDCAQSHGAKLSGKMTGTFGDAGCFSFYPTKNLGAVGDAGAIVTNDHDLADRLIHLRNYGSKVKYINNFVGVNSRLDEIQAAFLRVKIKYINQAIEHKRMLADVYFKKLPSWIEMPIKNSDEFDVFHIYGIRTNHRDRLRNYLINENIKTEVHYPIPPHKQKAMEGILAGDYPIADAHAATELSLPISFGHTAAEIEEVCYKISEFKP
jgi:dTDP-4-amino-4,6-dideoxygalactose transaminase